jgi:hypothetical protein
MLPVDLGKVCYEEGVLAIGIAFVDVDVAEGSTKLLFD